MTEYIALLQSNSLFTGIGPGEIPDLLITLNARRVKYEKNDLLIEEGGRVSDFGILLSGRGRAIKWEAEGRIILISQLGPGSMMGIMLAAEGEEPSPVTVEALEDTEVLQISYGTLFSAGGEGAQTLIHNYIRAVAKKGLLLHQRIQCLLRPTMREKVLTFLRQLSQKQESQIIEVPMSRNDMALYLDTDRSALSRELSAMKRDGLLDYHQSTFRLL